MESIRLFALCDAMQWGVLPVAGGLYDQHPKLLEEWSHIFQVRNEYQQEQHERQMREAKRKK